MTTSTYAIVHIPDNTPELAPTALGAHVTIRSNEPAPKRRKGEFTLTPRQQETVTLHDQGLTIKDIARRQGVSYESARKCLRRARYLRDGQQRSGYIASLINCPDCGSMHPPDDCDLVPCTGGCGDLVPEPEAGDPYCPDCLAATQPADDRAMQPAPSALAHDIAALNDAQYGRLWDRLLHEYLADPPATNDIDALQDALENISQDTIPRPLTSFTPSFAPTGPAAPPTRLAG